jgi:hypothetical protein
MIKINYGKIKPHRILPQKYPKGGTSSMAQALGPEFNPQVLPKIKKILKGKGRIYQFALLLPIKEKKKPQIKTLMLVRQAVIMVPNKGHNVT